MKKQLIIPVVVMSLLLAGCADNSTKKPKVYAPYSALVKNENTSLESESNIESESTVDSSVDLEEINSDINNDSSEDIDNSSEVIDNDDNSIDYDALADAIADKVADKIAEKIANEQSGFYQAPLDTNSISSSPASNNDDSKDNGLHIETVKDNNTSSYPDGTTISQKQDNSKAINEFNQAIATYEYEISVYQAAIDEANDLVLDFEELQNQCETNLKSAEIDLANAYKKKVYVFDGGDFKQVTDQGAVSKAQETVDYYKTQAERCRINKEETLKLIEQYKVEISARETQIAICQAAINELL